MRRCQPCDSSNQVTVRPPRRRQPHRAACPQRAADHGRLPHPRAQLRHPGPLRSVTSTRTMPSPALTVTVTVSPGTPGRLPDAVAEQLAPSSAASAPHGCPGPITPAVNARATRARSARPATVTLSRTAAPAISAPPSAAPPRKRAAGRTQGIHARLSGARQARKTPPARPVRGRPWKADGAHRPSWRPGRRPLSVRGHRNASTHGDASRYTA